MKTVFSVVLDLCALVLVYICHASIMDPINFEKTKKHRDTAVIIRLIDARKAQLKCHGLYNQRYTTSLDALVGFVKNQRLPFIFKQGELDDKQLGDGLTEKKAISIINKAEKTGNYAEIRKQGLRGFERDTIWVIILDIIFPKGFDADSMRYVSSSNDTQFEMVIKNDTARSDAPFYLLEAKTPYDVYLNGLDKQETVNLKDLQTKLGKYSDLMIGSLETTNNNTDNWEQSTGICVVETTDFTESGQHTLSIRLSADGFSFSIFNPLGDGKPSLHEHKVNTSLSLTANLRQVFRGVEWLGHSFRHVNVLMTNRRFTFIPLEFFEDEQTETIFYHNCPKQDDEVVQYDILHKNNIVALFGMDKSTYSLLREQCPDIRFYSQANPFIKYFATKSRLGNCREVYMHLRKEAIDIYACERDRLIFASVFACKETNDHVYYILYIWEQLGMEQERDELHLTSELSDKEEPLPELRRFIQQVFIMNPAYNLDLQAINLCE